MYRGLNVPRHTRKQVFRRLKWIEANVAYFIFSFRLSSRYDWYQ